MEAYRNKNFAKVYGWVDQFQKTINPGMMLMLVALITMVIANSPLHDWYQSIWNVEIFFGAQSFNLFSHHHHSLSLLQFVNDGIMAIFFFSVGLEIKREILVGELSSFRQALLPIIAAVGGMIVPILFFNLAGNAQGLSPDELKGMAIPMATDIAFSLGVLSLLGKKVPLSLKIFLLALAIVDDIGGILVIAIFYSDFTADSFLYLGLSLIPFAILMLGNRLRVNSKAFYILLGIAVWYLFLQSGIHPTIAGVLVAFTVPARPHINVGKYMRDLRYDLDMIESTLEDPHDEGIVLTNTQIKYLSRIEAASDRVISPLQDLEDNLHGIINYFIMPVFAFANAGVVFDVSNFTLFTGISLSVLVGLVFGKMSGIFLFTWLSIKLRISKMPKGMNWSRLLGIGMLGGIGFTVALFLGSLSYPSGSEMLNQAKLGIIFGSLFSGLAGFFFLKYLLNKKPKCDA